VKYLNRDGQTVELATVQGLWEYAERRFGEGLWLGFHGKPYSPGASIVISRNAHYVDRLTPINEGGA